MVDARRALAAFGVPVAPVAVINRSAYPAAALAGLATPELEPSGKAAKEMHALWRAVEKELSNGKANSGRRRGQEKPPPAPSPAPEKATRKVVVDDGRMTTSVRLRLEVMEGLKISGLRRRVRVNDVLAAAADRSDRR